MISHDAFAEQIRFALYDAKSVARRRGIGAVCANGDLVGADVAQCGGVRDASVGDVRRGCSVHHAGGDRGDVSARVSRGSAGGGVSSVARGEIPAGFHAPVVSNVPVLMISGVYDPVTPLRWAARRASRTACSWVRAPRDASFVSPYVHPDGGARDGVRVDDAAAAVCDRRGGERYTRVMRRIHARVTGRVQGVSYRASTIEEARRLGVTGWVRNRSDGSVELEAQGAAGQVEALLAWCAVGPPAARVSEVTVKDLPIVDGERGFSFALE